MFSNEGWIKLLVYFVVLFHVVSCEIEYERYDGWFNNLANPSWGTVGSPLSRVSPPVYEDGVYQPSGSTRPNPLLISSTLMSSSDVSKSTKSFRNASVMMVFFAQHIAHEIVDTSRPGCPPEYMNIHVPEEKKNDYKYKYIPFTRSNYHSDSGKSPNTPRQQINEATPWLDGGAIYGTSKSWTDSLRSLKDGKLSASMMGDWPGKNTMGLPMSNPSIPSEHKIKNAERLLKLGNHRGNENPFLLSLGIVWFRYHNRMADKIKAKHPDWNDEKIFNEARKWVIATYQHIAFYEWLPAFLSSNYTKETLQRDHPYQGYKNSVHPGVSHMFQSAAMRFAETMVPSYIVKRYPDNCTYSADEYTRWRLCNRYWNSEELIQMKDKNAMDNVKPILYGMVNQKAEAEDVNFVEDLQKFAYGPLEHSRRDLAAVTIQRGRDHGLPDYNKARMAFNLQPMKSFRAINKDRRVVPSKILDDISKIYKNDTNNIDIWVGGMLESGTHGPGELFSKIILDQFLRLRDGDRFWFENYKQTRHFTEEEVNEIKRTTFKDVIMKVTTIRSNQLQDDIFFVTNAKCPVKNSTLEKECRRPLETYDYFSGSEISFALTFLLVGLLPFIAVGILFALAKIRNQKRRKQLSESRKKSMKNSVQKDDETRFTAIEWENNSTSRVVSIKLGPGPSIRVLTNRSQVLRIINLKHLTWITAVRQSDKEQNALSLRVQREYDLVLTFNDVGERENFVRNFKSFISQESLNLDIQEHSLKGRELFATAVTREARQQQLEKFFRAAFARAFDLDSAENYKNFKLSANEIKDILACELSQTEFADALGMQATSPFVEQMFQMADKDANGYISFREFLDIMFIFAKGTPEDKLKLFFDMYDVTGEGKLDRNAFKKMMKSFMDVVSASVDPTNLDELVNSMFKTEGGQEKEFLHFEDFGSIMMDLDKKEGLLSDVNNVFKGATNTIASKAKSPKHSKSALDAESLTRKRKYGTVVQKDRFSGEKSTGSSPRRPGFTLSREKNIDFAPYYIRQWVTLTRYIENHRQHIFILTLYTLLVIGAFINKAYEYSVLKEFSGLRRAAGYGVSVSRGAAAAMTITFSTLLLTMCRNTLTFLRETQVMNWIPFDSAVEFHKYVAVLALFFTVVHTIGHAMNFYHFSTQSATALTCLFRNDFHRTHVLPTFTHYCWQTVTGLSGVLLCVVIAVLYVFATQYSRRVVFKFFWWTHQLYFALYALTIIHGSGHLLQPPGFHVFVIGPAMLFTIDKLISMARKKVEIPVVKAELLPSDVTNLQFKRPVNFNYKSGQWVRIACLELGGSEYHPFTLTSAPHEENLSLHIRAVGPWTINLRNTYNKDNLQDRRFPKLYLDGPFGEGHQDWYRYEVSVLVGGGIGVTPFASILKDIAHKGTLNSTFACKQVYFLWVTRTQKHFEWLTDIIREVEEKDTTGLVTVHIFITQFYEKFDLRTTMLYICERHFQKISGRSLFTGLQAITHFGRPNFNSTLRSISDVHPEAGKIGVFSCGPPAMTNSVEKTCAELNITKGPTFIHHFENF